MGKTPVRILDGIAKPFEPFWVCKDAVEGEEATIELYGTISEFSWWGDEITPQKFKDDLYRIGKNGPVTVRIHSGGGDVTAGSVIKATLMDYPGKVTVKIDGLCASAATVVAMAGDRVMINESAYMVIHDPWTIAMGNAEEFQSIIKWLDEVKSGIVDAYEQRTHLERNVLSKMMKDETWMSGKKAVELGFADEVITPESARSAVNAAKNQKFALNSISREIVARFKNIPEELIQTIDPDISQDNPVEGQESGEKPENKTRLEGLALDAAKLRAEAQTYL